MQAVMLSRPNLEKVAQKTDLMLDAKTAPEQEAVIDSLARRIQLGRPDGPAMRNTFQVSFDDNDPEVAHRVVRTLLDTFMEDSLGLKRTDSGVAQRFLESQIKDYEQKLVEAEDRLAALQAAERRRPAGIGRRLLPAARDRDGHAAAAAPVYSADADAARRARAAAGGRGTDLRPDGLGRRQPDRRPDRALQGAARPAAAAVHGEAPAGAVAQRDDRTARGGEARRAPRCPRPWPRRAPASATTRRWCAAWT